jgi:dihydroxy-acid dehydratase
MSSKFAGKTFRSRAWFGKRDKDGFIHRSWLGRTLPPDAFDGRPMIGICNTWSELTPCNAHFRVIAEHVKRGIWEAGAVPWEFPVTSLGETSVRPTAMLWRNLVSMDVEESIRANPIDGVVLLCGCDKTTPALIMGAASCDIPALVVSGGSMLNGHYRGETIGVSHLWKFAEEVKAGRMTPQEFMDAEPCMSRSTGTCAVMGTANTMAIVVDALGLSLPHNAEIPAVDSRRYALAHEAGRRIVDLVVDDVPISKILTRGAFENAIRVNGAVGGSTNAVIHLLAMAGRLGVPLTLDDWDRLGRDVPTLANIMPSGTYMMEDFYYAGGLLPIMRTLAEHGLLHRDALTVNGHTQWENCREAPTYDAEIVRPWDNPLVAHGGIAVLRGNLVPTGSVLKPSAASPHLMKHRGRAVVFEDIEHYKRRIEDPNLDVDPSCVLVLKNCGPKGYPGMAEVGNMGLPPKILQQGVEDMVRISDARMSGTAYGTVVLHGSPEAAVGGPLALVRDGDMIALDVEARTLHLEVTDEELARRKKDWTPPALPVPGGYQQLYVDHVSQADTGADFDFLVGCRGHQISRESH